MISHFFSWGLPGIAIMAMAVIHYVRRQPSFYWIYLILFLGPLGALIYLAIEALPELFDPGAEGGQFSRADQRKIARIE